MQSPKKCELLDSMPAYDTSTVDAKIMYENCLSHDCFTIARERLSSSALSEQSPNPPDKGIPIKTEQADILENSVLCKKIPVNSGDFTTMAPEVKWTRLLTPESGMNTMGLALHGVLRYDAQPSPKS
ncbi:unnamed protein product [Angiostrongylus costaricensis]|uniref:Uncharacterized protein n=1 Tax=Angiostrongylus costaricensis TaxID=334426 RepID=A0A0R3PMI3_ANGCS|nr:unnamed protein product [Angiostrongylus costaricensis]